MFERHILFKCHRTDAAAELARHTRSALGHHTAVLWLGAPADEASTRSWDLALRATFATEAALGAWLTSAAVAQWQAEVAEPACVVIKAWSFNAC